MRYTTSRPPASKMAVRYPPALREGIFQRYDAFVAEKQGNKHPSHALLMEWANEAWRDAIGNPHSGVQPSDPRYVHYRQVQSLLEAHVKSRKAQQRGTSPPCLLGIRLRYRWAGR